MDEKRFLFTARENRITEIIKKILRANGAKDVKSICIGTDEKRIVEIFGDVPLNNYPVVLFGISEASKKGEKFDHKREDGFLVIFIEKTKEEIAMAEKKLSSRIFGETMRNLEIPCV